MFPGSSHLMLLVAGAGHAPLRADDWRAKLSDPGKRAAQRVGAMLAERGWMPDVAVASGAAAVATAEKTLKAGGATTARLRIYDSIAPDDIANLLDTVGDVLLVATSDELAVFAAYFDALAGAAAFARLEIRGTHGLVRAQVRPDDLPLDFPFPAPGASERRPRPAYYYSQSAAVPFRRGDRGLEVLVIGSSSGRHRVVPKGIVDPGLSPAESALKEAREEGGVRGDVIGGELGGYRYRKWGAECTCAVFAMEVSDVLEPPAWEESHRGRQWLPVAEAASAVEAPELGAIIARLPSALEELS